MASDIYLLNTATHGQLIFQDFHLIIKIRIMMVNLDIVQCLEKVEGTLSNLIILLGVLRQN